MALDLVSRLIMAKPTCFEFVLILVVGLDPSLEFNLKSLGLLVQVGRDSWKVVVEMDRYCCWSGLIRLQNIYSKCDNTNTVPIGVKIIICK